MCWTQAFFVRLEPSYNVYRCINIYGLNLIYFRPVNQPPDGTSNGTRKRDSQTSFTKHNKVSASNGPDDGKQNSMERVLAKKDSIPRNPTPKTQVSAVTGSGSNLENSQAALGGGLEASFASLRRSSATPDLLNSSSVFDPSEIPQISSSKPSSAGSSSPRLKRPPTKESRSVSICETEVHVWSCKVCSTLSWSLLLT